MEFNWWKGKIVLSVFFFLALSVAAFGADDPLITLFESEHLTEKEALEVITRSIPPAAPDYPAASSKLLTPERLSYFLMKLYRIPEGVAYTVFRNPHYAKKELQFLGLVPGEVQPRKPLSTEQFFTILNNFSDFYEEQNGPISGGDPSGFEIEGETGADTGLGEITFGITARHEPVYPSGISFSLFAGIEGTVQVGAPLMLAPAVDRLSMDIFLPFGKGSSNLLSLSAGRVLLETPLGVLTSFSVDGVKIDLDTSFLVLRLSGGYQGFTFVDEDALARELHLARLLAGGDRMVTAGIAADPADNAVYTAAGGFGFNPGLSPSRFYQQTVFLFPELFSRQSPFIVNELSIGAPAVRGGLQFESAPLLQETVIAGVTGPFSRRIFYYLFAGFSALGALEPGGTFEYGGQSYAENLQTPVGAAGAFNIRWYPRMKTASYIHATVFFGSPGFVLSRPIAGLPEFFESVETNSLLFDIEVGVKFLEPPHSEKLGVLVFLKSELIVKPFSGYGAVPALSLDTYTGVVGMSYGAGVKIRPYRDLEIEGGMQGLVPEAIINNGIDYGDLSDPRFTIEMRVLF